MPQMAPLMWLYLYGFFLAALVVFMSINYFIKPFEKINLKSDLISSTPQPTWKL
uniref:ATP synthase complex subunit 8 n=1 Tax=Thalamita sima TaxID=600356 RepID=A0A8K1RD44_9EUCA|nr:ATP synthase F0 subunit 8 [Thalamita sima]